MALSLVQSLLAFYLLLCFARMIWAGPFELGLYGALNNWFVARRRLATAIATLAQMSGLVAIPMIAELAMGSAGDWRHGWFMVGTTVLIVGFLPIAPKQVPRLRPSRCSAAPRRCAPGLSG
jgi:MFS transporter, OFA family, oxalate/formate antiporter